MKELPASDQYYVAPLAAPVPRRPPVTEVGVVGWMRHNLFSSVYDTILTLVTTLIAIRFTLMFLSWGMLKAQWELVFDNLRIIGAGSQYPIPEVWRVELAAFILFFLCMLCVGVWGRVTRPIIMIVLAILAMMIIIPMAARAVAEPPYHLYLDATYNIRQVNFITQSGETHEFTIDPLTQVSDYDVEVLTGHIENDNRAANTSWDIFNEKAGLVIATTLDPAEYDLSLAVQISDKDGEVIAQSDFSEGSTADLNFSWTAPDDGWYTLTVIRDPENPGENGIAWLKAGNIEPLRSSLGATEEREAEFGAPPALECEGCATQAYRTDMRFQGERTVAQWFSLQLTPYLVAVRQFFFTAIIFGAVAYAIGRASKTFTLPFEASLPRWESALLVLTGVWVIAYVLIRIIQAVETSETLENLELGLLVLFAFTLTTYAAIQLLRGDGKYTTRAIILLWVVYIPVMLTIINGFEGSSTFPKVPSDVYGGLLLTIILSAVAIIFSFPIGMALALGRQSDLPVVRGLCTIFIEVLRGVPLITLIFMGRYVIQFFAAELQDLDLLIRMCIVLTLFTSAYMAEVIRGGLQIIPKGQLEAARALGLNNVWTTNLIVLPQALRSVIPAIMGQAVSLFKDTSLVAIIDLYELTGSMVLILKDSQTGYLAFPREGYLYIGIVYFVISYIMAEVSRSIEKTGSGAVRRDKI